MVIRLEEYNFIIIDKQSAAKFQNVYFEKGSETRWMWVTQHKLFCACLRYSPNNNII